MPNYTASPLNVLLEHGGMTEAMATVCVFSSTSLRFRCPPLCKLLSKEDKKEGTENVNYSG